MPFCSKYVDKGPSISSELQSVDKEFGPLDGKLEEEPYAHCGTKRFEYANHHWTLTLYKLYYEYLNIYKEKFKEEQKVPIKVNWPELNDVEADIFVKTVKNDFHGSIMVPSAVNLKQSNQWLTNGWN